VTDHPFGLKHQADFVGPRGSKTQRIRRSTFAVDAPSKDGQHQEMHRIEHEGRPSGPRP
jgi:hypothetical protein